MAVASAALLSIPREAQAISCVVGPFMVFFDRNEDKLTPQARKILTETVKAYGTCGIGSRVLIAGHADQSGPRRHNDFLSRRRADRVRAYLAAQGIPEEALVVESFGESRPLLATPDNAHGALDRRAEIVFGPVEDG